MYTGYKASSATALYSGGEPITRVQGAEFTDDVYYRGSRVKKQGTPYYGALYDADGEPIADTLYLGNGDYVYAVGSKVDDDLYYKGSNYSGGLYTSYKKSSASYAKLKLAELKTINVDALTV